MSIEIKSLNLGIASTNAYIIGDTVSKEAIVIDPVDLADLILKTAQEAGWTIKLILATHAHFDHVLASNALKHLTGAPFYTHKNSVEWLEALPQQGMMFTGKLFPEAAIPDRLLTDETEVIEVGTIRLETIYTPGHASDHLSYLMRDENIVFSGDCLFAGSIGRTDLPSGNYSVLMQSITQRLLPLGDHVKVIPGHMEVTSIGKERQTNPFIVEFLTQQS